MKIESVVKDDYPVLIEVWEASAHAVQVQGATKVDVNEQNVQAVGFYEHIGFKVIGRSEFDGQGRAYPLLHMELA